MSLVTKLIAGITFLGVFVLNVLLFVKVDNKGISVSTSKAYAVNVNDVPCGWWYCPEPDCISYPRVSAGTCQFYHIFTPLVQRQCDPNGGGGEEEEEEASTAFDREVTTSYTVYSTSCPNATFHKWWTCDDITCEGSGSLVCDSNSPDVCYWGPCL